MFRIAAVLGRHIAVQALRASLSSKATALRKRLRDANARSIASKATALGQTRVVATLGAGLAANGVHALASARHVLVLEAARSSAEDEVLALRRIGGASRIIGAGTELATAGLLGGNEGEPHGGEGEDVS